MTLDLLNHPRFRGLFWTQFLGAMNDNFFKNALVILTLFRLAQEGGPMLVTAAAGIFILPFFLFSALAGQIADKYERSAVTRRIKIAEIVIMACGAAAMFAGHIPSLLLILFLMGTQSTLFGPIKYGVLQDLVGRGRLMDANALFEAGTFLAILFGTIAGGILILQAGGLWIVSIGMLGMAVLGYLASRQIPALPAPDPSLKLNPNFLGETVKLMRYVSGHSAIWKATLGISWFWFVGAVFLAQVPTFTKVLVGGNEALVTFFLAIFSIGIGVGSFLAARITQGRIRLTSVPFAAIGMAIFTVDLYFAARSLPPASENLIGIGGFLSTFSGWRIVVDLLGISASGGLFVVPLFAAVQAWAEDEYRSRVIAAVSIVNAALMVASSVITLVLQTAGLDVAQIFLLTGLANVVVAVYVIALLPDDLLRGIARGLFAFLYRVEVKGLENLENAGERAVVVVNHLSLLDAPIMLSVLSEKPLFAIYTGMAKKWWVKPFLSLVEAMPVDPAHPMTVKTLTSRVKEGGTLVIFPEGRITVTGALMKIYDGPALIADKADAMIVPARIEGAERTPFSRLTDLQVRRSWFPKITVTFGAPERLKLPENLKGPARRLGAADKLYDIMCRMQVEAAGLDQTIFTRLIHAAERHGHGWRILEDALGNEMTYGRLLAGSFVLGRQFEKFTTRHEHVGVMLPNANAAVATFMALQAKGRVPAMINFTSGLRSILAGCVAAEIKTILTSRSFIEQGKLEELAEGLEQEIELVYLEDIRTKIGVMDKLKGLWQARKPAEYANQDDLTSEHTGAILFTSGSEGTPKGVVLSHKNLLANCAQAASRVDFTRQDKVFNVLPIFHSFGLTGGLLLPILNGAPIFLYPTPLHYKIIPEAVYGTNSTILFGTDTFLAGYAKRAHPYDFRSLRFILAGAEKLKPATREIWMEKFGHRIFEGYGLTETAPAAALNTPMHNRTGTVGRLVPMMEYRLEEVPGMTEGQRLHLKGPNVMKGYLKADNPGVLEVLDDGWFDTGDIVEVDTEGFITIKGRAKRFAKIAGEMVSLGAVEALIQELWPEDEHAVTALPDPRKGEKLVLLTTRTKPKREEIQAQLRATGDTELMLPQILLEVDQIPLLGTGKLDIGGCKAMAMEALGEKEPA